MYNQENTQRKYVRKYHSFCPACARLPPPNEYNTTLVSCSARQAYPLYTYWRSTAQMQCISSIIVVFTEEWVGMLTIFYKRFNTY